MVDFRDEKLGLPSPSWNLWEDRRGIHTYTCSAVVAGLRAAAKFAHMFAEKSRARKYERVAREIVAAMREHLYSKGHDRFLRSLSFNGDEGFEIDPTIDASLFGLFYFDVFTPNDGMVEKTMSAVREKLWVNEKVGGVSRFEDDGYMRDSIEPTSNPWMICTLWLADYYIARAENLTELGKAKDILKWVTARSLDSGVLAEQIHPESGEPVSVSPLTWSHSTFVASVAHYKRRFRDLS